MAAAVAAEGAATASSTVQTVREGSAVMAVELAAVWIGDGGDGCTMVGV